MFSGVYIYLGRDVKFKHLKRHQKPLVFKYRVVIVIYFSHLFLYVKFSLCVVNNLLYIYIYIYIYIFSGYKWGTLRINWLKTFAHDMINLFYYEQLTGKQKKNYLNFVFRGILYKFLQLKTCAQHCLYLHGKLYLLKYL